MIKKILLITLVLALVGFTFLFFFYQMERSDLLHLRDQTDNRLFPLENRLFNLAEEINSTSVLLGDFLPLEKALIDKISVKKEKILEKGKDDRPRLDNIKELYSDISLFLKNLERYPDLFRERDFVQKTNRLHSSLAQLKLNVKRYNEDVATLNKRLDKPLAKLIAKREMISKKELLTLKLPPPQPTKSKNNNEGF